MQNTQQAIFQEFQGYLALSDDLVAMSSKEDLVRAARILAMQAAHYAAKYGAEPLRDLGSLLAEPALSTDTAIFLRDGAKTFVGVLGAVGGALQPDAETSVQ